MPASPHTTGAAHSDSTGDWCTRITTVLQRQHELVAELAGYARRQSAMISASQTDALLDLLNRRQQVIDAFAHSQTELSTLTRGLEDRLAGVDEPRRARIRSLLSGIADALSTVMAQDEQDQAALAGRRNQTRDDLSSLGTARQARGAYLASPPGSHAETRYADRNA